MSEQQQEIEKRLGAAVLSLVRIGDILCLHTKDVAAVKAWFDEKDNLFSCLALYGITNEQLEILKNAKV